MKMVSFQIFVVLIPYIQLYVLDHWSLHFCEVSHLKKYQITLEISEILFLYVTFFSFKTSPQNMSSYFIGELKDVSFSYFLSALLFVRGLFHLPQHFRLGLNMGVTTPHNQSVVCLKQCLCILASLTRRGLSHKTQSAGGESSLTSFR